jgi:hypothetical protein
VTDPIYSHVESVLDGFDSSHFVIQGSGLDLATNDLSATISRDITQASTVVLAVNDHDRTILNDGFVRQRSVLDVGGLRFALVKVAKSGNALSLTFEDKIINDLRQQRGAYSVAPGVLTRAQFARQLCGEIGQPILAYDGPISAEALTRGTSGSADEDSWAALTRTGSAVGYRVFSDGVNVFYGPDEWLRTAVSVQGITISEYSEVCDAINFDYDVGKPLSTATVDTYAGKWRQGPGGRVDTSGLGPASQSWIVQSLTRELHRRPAVVTLVAPNPVLPEPKAAA